MLHTERHWEWIRNKAIDESVSFETIKVLFVDNKVKKAQQRDTEKEESNICLKSHGLFTRNLSCKQVSYKENHHH